jgi:hypothetical protein
MTLAGDPGGVRGRTPAGTASAHTNHPEPGEARSERLGRRVDSLLQFADERVLRRTQRGNQGKNIVPHYELLLSPYR